MCLESLPALDLIRQHDTDGRTLFYVDPPYLLSTRNTSGGNNYRYELTEADHVELSHVLNAAQGMVVLSGYPSALYDDLYRGWHRVEREALADRAGKRTEVLWLNHAATQPLPGLFALG